MTHPIKLRKHDKIDSYDSVGIVTVSITIDVISIPRLSLFVYILTTDLIA